MKRRIADQLCSKCDQPGYRCHGRRWLCVVHFRFQTMKACARSKGKREPLEVELDAMARDLIDRDMKCEVCSTVMQWSGKKGEPHTVSLQHDRSGRLRLICMACNQRHNDLPGDTFYDLPPNHWYCARCKRVLPLTDFYANRAGACCKSCRKTLNKEMWAKHGKEWAANSARRKHHANH